MTDHPARIIGLTGGIACGKSTVSDYLAQRHHCIILDADLYAREAVSPESPILKALEERYGSDILLATGELNRTKLGEIIFNDAQERYWLEHVIHPYVRQRLIQDRDRHLKNQTRHPLVLVIPLLFESGMEDLVTEIWVVFCTTDQQQQRLMARNGLAQKQAQARIQSQWPLADKMKQATITIDNSGRRDQVYQQVDQALLTPESFTGEHGTQMSF